MWVVLGTGTKFGARFHVRQDASRQATVQRAVRWTLHPTRRVRPTRVGPLMVQ